MDDRDASNARMFEVAASLHENGRLAEAERLYQAILTSDGTHFGGLHGLGVLRAQQGSADEALGLLLRALERDPTRAETGPGVFTRRSTACAPT